MGMSLHLDHTIVRSADKTASAEFFAHIFDLQVAEGGHFAPVRINDHLTLDFADAPTGAGVEGQHYAFVVDEDDFDIVFERIRETADSYGSGPYSSDDGRINHRRGGRGVYFRGAGDPHLWEIMTTPETSAP